MKRLRSSDDLDSPYSDKASGKDVKESSNPNPNRASMSSSTSSHRGFYYKSDNVRKGLVSPSSSSRYERDRSLEDDGRVVRKRTDHDFDSFDRRKNGFDRYSSRDSTGGGGSGGMHRSESFSGSRRDFPKGFRSERDRTRREGSISSWRRFGSERKEFGIGNKEFGSERKEFGVGNKEFGSERKEFGVGSERKEFGGGSKDIGGERKDFEESSRGSSREDRGGKMLREVMKSPSWSRDSGSEQSRVKGVVDSRSKSKSRSRSSPTWSKDSVGSEQSKSLEVAKKNVEVEVEVPTEAEVEVKSDGSGSSSSEMEEGELEPEVDPDGDRGGAVDDGRGDEIEVKENDVARVDCDDKDENRGHVGEDVVVRESKENVSEGKDDSVKEVDKVPKSEELNVESTGNSEKGSADAKESDKVEVEDARGDSDRKEKGNEEDVVNKNCVEEEQKERLAVGFELRTTKVEIVPESNMNQNEEVTGGCEMNVHTESLNCSIKDKGKGVAVTSTHDADSADNGVWMERDLGVTATWKADEMEGPSTRGFELFTSSPVRKTEEKPEMGVNNKDKELMESLDLSLSLPNVLLPIGARDTNQGPGSPSHGRSVSITNTFRTNSDGFTASMSFSGSQSFFHNPSCSLTQNSLDNLEQSVHSHPVFKGVDWQALAAQNESSRHKEIPLYQRILMNGNGSVHQSQTSLQNSQQNVRVAEGSTKMPNGLERQLSFNKQNDVRSPTHSVGSHDIGQSYSFEKRGIREKPGGSGSLYRSGSLKEQEEYPVASTDFMESVLGRIVSDPIQVMARKFNEMSGHSLVRFKDSIRELMLSKDKKGHLSAIQNALHSRSDINMEVLSKAHRTQLLILVALKTGLPEYLQLDSSVSSSDVAEIFLNSRCRNLMCRSPLPVDECECKVCSKKNGFCSACMCLVCSKFDMASNTCSWVGCDVCLHWCHADCGLRESFIRNGNSESGAQGGFSEMQFFCVACDHPSEMFGFVKEVFQNFAKEWSAETMCRELEYVKRIFRGSKDLRGRRLHEIADQMLARLLNKSEVPEVLSYIMAFLTGKFSQLFCISEGYNMYRRVCLG